MFVRSGVRRNPPPATVRRRWGARPSRRRAWIAAAAWTVALGLPARAAAQPSRFEGGLTAGVAAGTLVGSVFTSGGGNVDAGWRAGLTAGGYGLWRVDRQLALEADLLVTQRGATADADPIRLTMLELPLLAEWTVRPGRAADLRLTGGTVLAARLSATAEVDGRTRDLEDELQPFDAALALGAGVDVARWRLDVRFVHGLVDIRRPAPFQTGTIRHRAFVVLASVPLFR